MHGIEKQIYRDHRYIALGETNDNFFRHSWMTIDLYNADYLCDFRKDTLPFDDCSLDAVYTSHVIEHLTKESGIRLFREIYRCLKPNGYCRIVTPDMDLLLDRYKSKDWRFFLQADGQTILNEIKNGILLPESLLIHNRLIGWFASYSGRLDTAGGPIVDFMLVEKKIATLSKYEFRNWCVSLLEPGRIYAHIHLYDYEELKESLVSVGFEKIGRKSWGETSCPAMLKPIIDIQCHKSYSLYVEAIK